MRRFVLLSTLSVAVVRGAALAEELGTCLLARALALRFAQVYFDQYIIELGLHDPEPFPPPPRDDGRKLQSLTLMRGLYVGPRLAWTYIWKEDRPASDRGIGGRIFYFHVNHPVWTSGQAGGGLALEVRGVIPERFPRMAVRRRREGTPFIEQKQMGPEEVEVVSLQKHRQSLPTATTAWPSYRRRTEGQTGRRGLPPIPSAQQAARGTGRLAQ